MSSDGPTAADYSELPWLEVANPGIRLGKIRHGVFDFDGTISVIRQGWEQVMIPLMVQMICDGRPAPPEIEKEVADYVDRSTGILTIKQMRWLEEAVQRYGFSSSPRTARQYKTIYNERLLKPVRERMRVLSDREESIDALAIVGARNLVRELCARGVTLYLASGTDHVYVLEEATALGVAEFFGGRIFGARDDSESCTKERIIQRIMDEHGLVGEELLVVGDGPVEIRNAKARGAVTLGVAADEERRMGLDPRKRGRLLAAGADLIVTDLGHFVALADMLVGPRSPETT